LFEKKPSRSFSRIPILKTKYSIFRTYLTVPWVPRPEYRQLVNSINE
jgi:hypothetical protein